MRRLLILAVLCSVLLPACSKSDSDSGDGGNPAGPSAPTQVFYTAIGASDAVGIGASVPCLPFADCPSGTGYVPRILRELRSENGTVGFMNLGLPGAVLTPEVQALGNQVGVGINHNFLDNEAPFVPRETTLVTVFAGGNDVNTVATAIDRGAAGSQSPDAYIDAQIAAFAAGYRQLLDTIRSRAPSARIYVLNLPNFAGLPFARSRPLRDRRWLQRLSVGFTTQGANALLGGNVTVIDLMCDPRAYQAGTYSGDGFHPNDTGYAFLAQVVLDAIRNGAPPPNPSCGQMRLVE
ncbi:MAG TPA: SGNH/GDSL hydrolase family protein [Vicinamibacterales bacterium]